MRKKIDREEYDRVWEQIAAEVKNAADSAAQYPYIREHKDRFFELFEHMSVYLADVDNPRVLEFGTSSFSLFIKRFFPDIELVTADRPIEMHGYPPIFAMNQAGSVAHYQIDHNTTPIGPNWGNPPIGQFDYVLFCEILEHLTINPVELLEELISLLKPDGLLYLTTPNFFSHTNILKMERLEHPGQLYRRRGKDDHAAAMHVREYTLHELVTFSEEAGGKVIKAIYSGILSNEYASPYLQKMPEYYSNLVILVAPKGSSRQTDQIMNHDPSISWAKALNGEDEGISIPILTRKIELLTHENDRLRTHLNAIENGRIMRLLNWLSGS